MTDRSRVVHRDPEILGGTPVFVGTRVPLQNLIDYVEAGDTLDGFLDSFASVTREQAIAALEMAREETSATVVRPGRCLTSNEPGDVREDRGGWEAGHARRILAGALNPIAKGT